MAVPPSYSDLGKAAKDIFSKGYGFGVVKLDLKTKSQSGVEFNTSGSSNTDTGKASGSLENKYKMKELGLSFSQKWNTDNMLATEVTVEDQLTQGLKIALDTSFVPNTGKKSGKLKTGYKRDYVNLGCDVDFEGPIIHAAAVLGYEGWLAGYQMAFDTAKSKLVQNNFALGYRAGDFQLHTNVNDGTEFGGSIYQKVNDELETAVTLAWTAGSNNTRFGIATKYKLDKDASLSAKVNNASLIGVGYTQSLRPGPSACTGAVCSPSVKQAGMRISTSKSEAMVLDRKRVACPLRVGGEVLPQVEEEFKYLWVLSERERWSVRLTGGLVQRPQLLCGRCTGPSVVKKELSRKAKLSIYRSIYVPTLTYGHELWRSCGYKWRNESFLRLGWLGAPLEIGVRSSVTREELGVEPLLLRIERSQLRWLGHLFRMPPGRLPREVFQACPTREEAQGKKTQDTLERLCLSAGLGTPRGPPGRAGGSVWGVKVTLSALIDGKNFNAGGHKVGMGFELEA
ncbi:hypothetical protein L3Q82_002189 [Scortum barcoo]|uniref:Uncharacterized protein n=1 Tax=Scortum barcoo TaxID=214431 RepID=A0ACB8W249_9TELE|nr:hypothetical protein L3Q82_002189 [Scortum barcoo]